MNTERNKKLRKARKIFTAFVVMIVMPLCCYLLSPIGKADELSTATPLPTATPTVTPTKPPELITVEYQIEVVSEGMTLVEFWHTSKAGGQNETDSQRIRNSGLISTSIQIASGERVELSGFLGNDRLGELTCRIIADDVLIEQSHNQGVGAGVYCSGVAITRPD